MKAGELRELTDDEMRSKSDEYSSELMNLRFQKAKRVLENPARMRTLRRGVARINTILRERELSKGKSEDTNGE